jgi:type II secretory pathway pseudopilin PulG
MEREPVDQLNATVRRGEETVSKEAARRGNAGFTLLEALVALLILTVGLLGLAQAFYLGMRHMSMSSANLIAREKAREAVESVHTARDTGLLSWEKIRNFGDGEGIFLTGAQPLYNAGADGLVNTDDDDEAGIESLRDPGPNGLFGDVDDVLTPLDGFTREIVINALPSPTGGEDPDLRELIVTIRFQVGAQRGSYTLRTYVSAFS